MRKRLPFLPTRWLEVADSPAVAAAILTAVLCAAGFGSCTSTTAASRTSGQAATARGDAKPPRTDPPQAALTKTEGEPIIRVRLIAETREVTLAGPKALIVGPPDKPEAARSVPTPVRVMRLETGWLLRDGSGANVAFGNPAIGAPAAPLSVRSADAALILINDAPYPGELTLHPRDAKRPPPPVPATAADSGAPVTRAPPLPGVHPFDVVEHIGIETYLPGVISRELLPNWSLTAFKAQAIAARTYALHERERSRGLGEAFDLESSQLDQVYGGSTQHAAANRAVAETRGQVLMFEGKVLRAYYSSTCGGRPASAKDVWPTTKGFEFNLAAPIQGSQGPEQACGFSPRSKWTLTRTREDLSKRLAAFGRDQNLAVRGLTLLTRVEPTAATREGRPTSYRLFDSDGRWFALSAEQLRTGCNWIGASGQPPVTAQTRVLSGDLAFTLRGNSFTIEGRGFGHGVGMCQYGAEGRARLGETPEQILMHYYPGATIVKSY